MSTTFAIKTSSGELREIARRVGGPNGAIINWIDPIGEYLSDDTRVIPTDNTAQGIETIKDIRDHIALQREMGEREEKDRGKIFSNQRSSVFMPLESGWSKEGDFIEVTEWTNGEGYDVQINEKQQFSLHFTEWEALNTLIAYLEEK
jgi:hypothetical protein